MKLAQNRLLQSTTTALALVASVFAFLPSHASAQTARTPLPASVLTDYPAIGGLALSPDGKHLAGMMSERDTMLVAVWRTAALNEPPKRIAIGGAAARKGVRLGGVDWVSNERLLVFANQPVVYGSGAEGKGYTGMVFLSNIDGSGWMEPLAGPRARTETERFVGRFSNINLLNDLPNQPDHILVSQSGLDGTSVFKVNVKTGAAERTLQIGSDESISSVVDNRGVLRVKQFATPKDGDWIVGYRIANATTGAWEEHDKLSYVISKRTDVNILGFDPENNDIMIVRSNKDSNTSKIYGYSLSRRDFVETMFAHPQFDATRVAFDYDANLAPKAIAGFWYNGDTNRPVWADPAIEALERGLRQRFTGQNVYMSPKHGDVRLVTVESSRHAPSYYLLRNELDLIPLGSSNPQVDSSTLADTQMIHYTARDGLRIPGFLTLPKGWKKEDGPLPVMIQPHGGPWSRNNSSWRGGDMGVGQYYASRGFAVLEPQFRGSDGLGDELWKAGDGQWGMAMQDDKDDGLKHLVEQGIADPRRAVMYGFSYGGFAAMAATVRPNSPYKCAISGAGVSSLERIQREWGESRIQRRLQGRTVKGMDPLQNVAKANIPILIYHGDRDQTATISHSQQFAQSLTAAGKPHKFVTIKDFAHGGGTPAMEREIVELVDSYIKNECGIPF